MSTLVQKQQTRRRPGAHLRAALAAVVGLGMPATGCQQASPTSTPDAPLAAARTAGAIRTDGAFVFRGQVPGGLLMVDFDREPTLLVGNTAAQLGDICATGALPGGNHAARGDRAEGSAPRAKSGQAPSLQ